MWCWQEAPHPSCWVRIKEVLSGAQKAALGLAGGEPEPEVGQWPEVKEKGTGCEYGEQGSGPGPPGLSGDGLGLPEASEGPAHSV